MITGAIGHGVFAAMMWAALLTATIFCPMIFALRWRQGWIIGGVSAWLFPLTGIGLISSPYESFNSHLQMVVNNPPAWLYTGLVFGVMVALFLRTATVFIGRTLSELMLKWKRVLAMYLPVVIPILAAVIYAPINEDYLVGHFGCGCKSGFNTNSITLIIFSTALVIEYAFTALVSIGLVGWRSRTLSLATCMIIQGYVTLRMMALNIWL